MNLKTTLFLLIFSMLSSSVAIAQDGSISEEELKKIRSSIDLQGDTKALMNAISSNSIRKIAVNRENIGKLNDFFSDKIDIKGITNQKSSGRCWLFTGLNVLRVQVIEKYNLKDFSFSHTYSFFWDQFEKSNLFLEAIINTADKPMDDRTVDWLFKHPIGDGGQWTGVVNIVDKYGLVPAEAMPESENSENTSMMRRLLRRKLRGDGIALRQMHKEGMSKDELKNEKIKMLKDIYRILVLSLGNPPSEFTWQYKNAEGEVSEMKTYTPQSFYEKLVDVDLNDYVMFMNDPSRDYYKLYEIEYDRHMHEGGNWKYINLPIDEIKPFAVNSIKNNQAMYFSCDVGKQLDRSTGTLDLNNYDYNNLFGVDFNMDKSERIKTYDSGSSHGMSLVAVNIDNEGSVDKWLLENSWGKRGHNGFLIMTSDWFDEYMFRLVIHKDFIDDKILKILDEEPIMLPPWDPMFVPEK